MPVAYLALSMAEPGALPDGELLARIARALPFDPDVEHVKAVESSMLVAWNKGETLGAKARWHDREGGATVAAGYGVDDASGALLEPARLRDAADLKDAWWRVPGEWSACALGHHGLVAASSQLGTEHVYCFEGRSFVAISNRARLLWETMRVLARARPRPDHATLSCVLSLGFPFCTDGTAVAGVRLVPSTHQVVVDEGAARARLVELDPLYFLPKGSEPVRWDELAERSRATVCWLRNVNAPVIASLTGGKDSRLVLALSKSAGVLDKVRHFHIGAPPEHADHVVARSMCDSLGLQLRRTDRPPPPDLVRALEVHTGFAEGLLNAWDLQADARYEPQIGVHGLLGEIYRRQLATDALRPRELASRIVRPDADFAGLLRPDVLRQQRSNVERWLEALEQRGLPSEHGPDVFYLRQRIPRWMGQAKLRGTLVGLHFNPLAWPELLRTYYGLSREDRLDERIHFEMMVRHWPSVVGLPFANARWSARMVARSTRPKTSIASGVVSHAAPILGTGWQLPALAASWRDIRARIEDSLPRLGPIVVPTRVRALLDVTGERVATTRSSARTARVLLRHPWLYARSRSNVQPLVRQTLGLLTVVALLDELEAPKATRVAVA